MSSNEKEIREKIRSLYQKDNIVLDEFTGGRMVTRPDLAILNEKRLIFVEIKSDRDSLYRLDRQLNNYSLYSHSILLVLDIVHEKKFKENYDKYKNVYFKIVWYNRGVLSCGNRIIEKQTDIFIYSSMTLSITHMFSLLWRNERLKLISFFKGRSKVELNSAIFRLYTVSELHDIILFVLVSRSQKKIVSETKMISGGDIPEVKHLEHKQQLIDELIKEIK